MSLLTLSLFARDDADAPEDSIATGNVLANDVLLLSVSEIALADQSHEIAFGSSVKWHGGRRAPLRPLHRPRHRRARVGRAGH